MYKKSKVTHIIIVAFLSVIFTSTGFSETIGKLGDQNRLVNLFSCPNNINDAITKELILDTVEHYLNQSFTRDQYPNEIQVLPPAENQDIWNIKIPGSKSQLFYENLSKFLKIGDEAFISASKIKNDGIWRAEWRFFLQLGLPINNNKAVHLLHFPPDTVLETQDYLKAATIKRWGRLLIENGILKKDISLYHPIVDIAPIATKANEGETLTPTYKYFKSYVHNMLDFLSIKNNGIIKPTVIGGYPARQWCKNEFKASKLKTLDLLLAQTKSGNYIPMIGAHHPSYIWYASKKYRNTNLEKAYKIDLSVMTSDLIASLWKKKMADQKIEMGESVTVVKNIMNETLNDCTKFWTSESGQKRAFELVLIEVYGHKEKELYRILMKNLKNIMPKEKADSLLLKEIEETEISLGF